VTDSIYLDHASATPIRAVARGAMNEALDAFGDPIQGHREGRRASALLEDARQVIADGIRAQADEVVFTSGGTESVALAIAGVARARGDEGRRVVISAIEHPCVFGAGDLLKAAGFEIQLVGVDEFGRLDLDAFMAAVRAPGTILASVQHASHEVGTLQPVAEAARFAREAKVLFHCDAAQTNGRLPLDVEGLGVDLLSVSGHKFGAPPGIGALYVRRGTPLIGSPAGDIRERHRRAGAENLAGASAMGAAFTEALAEMGDQAAAQWELTGQLRAGLAAIPGVTVHGHPAQRAPHLVGFSVADADPEVVLMALDDRHIAISCGCVARGLPGEASGVLEAMGVSGTVSFRVSTWRDTTEADVARFLGELGELTGELRRVERATRESLSRRAE